MKFSVAAATLVSLLPAVLGLTIDTPTNVVQCQPILLTWRDGTPPYFLSLIQPRDLTSPPIMSLPNQQGTTYTWTVNLQANTNFNLALKDSTGLTAYSDLVTVQASSDNSCLTSGSSNSSSPANTGGTSPTNTGSGSPASSPASGGSGTSTRTSTTSTPTSGGSTTGGATGLALSSFGVAGVIGAVAALF